MVNTVEFVRGLEATLKPYEGIKFSSIGDMCTFRGKLDKALNAFAQKQKGIKISGKLEIKSKTTLTYTVTADSGKDVFYPDWVCRYKYVKEFDVFSRGKRNSTSVYKVQPIDRTDAIICACKNLLGSVSNWKERLSIVFDDIKVINKRPVMSPAQREFVDKVRILSWNCKTLSETRDTIISLIHNGLDASRSIPLNTKALSKGSEDKTNDYGCMKTTTKVCIKAMCKFCVKWMNMRNDGTMNLDIASCPILGRKTRSTFSCGNFKHF